MIYYTSLTGNVRRFVGKVGMPAEVITPDLIAPTPFVFVTYTIGFGEVPKGVADFLHRNSENLRGVAVSGNRVWGANFGKAGEIIAREFGVPLLHKFELSGTAEDIRIFTERMIECDIYS